MPCIHICLVEVSLLIFINYLKWNYLKEELHIYYIIVIIA